MLVKAPENVHDTVSTYIYIVPPKNIGAPVAYIDSGPRGYPSYIHRIACIQLKDSPSGCGERDFPGASHSERGVTGKTHIAVLGENGSNFVQSLLLSSLTRTRYEVLPSTCFWTIRGDRCLPPSPPVRVFVFCRA